MMDTYVNRSQSPTTYEISQYQKKPRTLTNRTMALSQSNTYHYDQYFNQNFQNSIALTDYEEEEKQKRQQEAYNSLLQQNEKLSKEMSILKDQMEKLVDDNAFLENKVGKLSEQNEEMSRLINEQKNQLMLHEQDANALMKHNEDIANELDRTKKSLRNSIIENDDLKGVNNALKNEANKLKSDKDLLHQKCLMLNDQNRKNQELLNKIKDEHDNLQNDALESNKNKNAMIEDLKNQIDSMKNYIDKTEKDKNYYEDKYNTLKNDSDKKINDLNNRILILTKEKEDFAKKAGDNKKLSQQLLREKEGLIERINGLENDLQNALSKTKSKGPTDNQILIECLKTENYDLKELNANYKKMLDLLFRFVNDLNDIFNHEEISIEQCKEDINYLNDDLNVLKEDIMNLINSGNESDEKWNDLQNKLLNKKITLKEQKSNEEEEEVGNDWKSGKCAACDLGRNVSLKGCSPFFCKKHKFKNTK